MPTPRHAVLLITHAADHFTIDRVQAGVARRGATPIRLDTDRFPGHHRLTTRVGPAGLSVRLRAADVDLPIDASHPKYRSWRPGAGDRHRQ